MLKREQFRGGNDHEDWMNAIIGRFPCLFEIGGQVKPDNNLDIE
jgi:hypothetical protein